MPYPSLQGEPRIQLQGSPMGYVPEFRDEGNDITASALAVTLANSPDLQVTRVAVPEHMTTGRGFNLTYDVTNTGVGTCPTGRMYGRITSTCRATNTWTCAAICTWAAWTTPGR